VETQLFEIDRELAQCPEIPPLQVVSNAGYHSGFAPTLDAARWIQLDLGNEYAIDSVVIVPACINGAGAYGFPGKFRVETSRDVLMSESELLLETTVEEPSSILPHCINAGGVRARYVRFTALSLVPQPRMTSRFIFCLGEILVFSGGRDVALQAAVLAPNSVETLPTWSPKHVVDGSHGLGIPSSPLDSGSNGWHSQIFRAQNSECWVQVDLGGVHTLDEIRLIPAHPRDYPDRAGFGFPLRFKIEVSLTPTFSEPALVFDGANVDFANPGETQVAFPCPRSPIRYLRVTAQKLWERSGDFVFALGELEAFEGRQNIARNAVVTASDSTTSSAWRPSFLVDGIGGAGMLQDDAAWLHGLSRRRLLLEKREELIRIQKQEIKNSQERSGRMAQGFVVLAVGSIALLFLRGRITRAREIEVVRQQISRDLHDDVGSNLCSIRLMAEMSCSEKSLRPAEDVLSEIRTLAEKSTESLRDMVWLLKERGQPGVETLVEKMRGVAGALLVGMEWNFTIKIIPAEAVAPISFHRDILFVFREALHNIVKHSGASSVEIQFSWNPSGVEMCVVDRGCGFDPKNSLAGDGIENMRYRTGHLNGTLLIDSRVGEGTRLVFKMPKP